MQEFSNYLPKFEAAKYYQSHLFYKSTKQRGSQRLLLTSSVSYMSAIIYKKNKLGAKTTYLVPNNTAPFFTPVSVFSTRPEVWVSFIEVSCHVENDLATSLTKNKGILEFYGKSDK